MSTTATTFTCYLDREANYYEDDNEYTSYYLKDHTQTNRRKCEVILI